MHKVDDTKREITRCQETHFAPKLVKLKQCTHILTGSTVHNNINIHPDNY